MFTPLIAVLAALSVPTGDRAAEIHRKIADPDGGLVVVAHRGCHAAAPGHALDSAPENSLAALDHCVAMGVDVMETDVRRAADGSLVMIHDATLDRTTDGRGPVAAMTLPQLRARRLKAQLGGRGAALTDARIVTLDEMLAHAKGRIVLNLDVKEPIHAQVIAAVVRAGAQADVIVKRVAGERTRPLAAMAPFTQVPFMPVLRFSRSERRLVGVARRQLSGTRAPVALELPRLSPATLSALAGVAREKRLRLWINTLEPGYVAGYGGDAVAATDPARVWGRIMRQGGSMIQTDNPEGLLRWAQDNEPAG